MPAANSAVAHISTQYNTGYMVDPDGAWANDASTTAIGTPWNLYEDFNALNKTVFTDDFNRTDPAPWVAGNGADVSIVEGKLRVANTIAARGYATLAQDTVIGNWYKYTVTALGPNTARINVGTAPGGIQNGQLTGVLGTVDITFQATATTTYFTNQLGGNVGTEICDFDNVLIEEVPALDGWEAGADSIVSVTNQRLRVTTGAATPAFAYKEVTVTNGANYIASGEVFDLGSSSIFMVGTTAGGNQYGQSTDKGEVQLSFTTTSTQLFVSCYTNTTAISANTEFDNITIQEDPTGTDALPDNSGQSNDATVIGQALRDELGTSGLYGLHFVQPGGVTGTGTIGGNITGYEQLNGAWFYRRNAEEFFDATNDGGTWQINAPEDSRYAFLTYNGTPMTSEQAADTAADLAGIIDDEPNGDTC